MKLTILLTLLTPALSFGLSQTKGIPSANAMDYKLKVSQCFSPLYKISDPSVSKKQAWIKSIEDEIFSQTINGKLTSSGEKLAQYFLRQSLKNLYASTFQTVDKVCTSGVEGRTRHNIEALQKRVIAQLIQQNILPEALLATEYYFNADSGKSASVARNLGLLSFALNSMSEMQKIEFLIISTNSLKMQLWHLHSRENLDGGHFENLRAIFRSMSKEKLKALNLSNLKGLWKMAFHAEKLDGVDSKTWEIAYELRRRALNKNNVKEIMDTLEEPDNILAYIKLDFLFNYYYPEMDLLNEVDPMFLPRIIEKAMSRYSQLPKIDFSSMTKSGLQAFGKFSENSKQYGGSTGSGSGSSYSKLYSEWEYEELLKLLKSEKIDSGINALADGYFKGFSDKVRIIKSNRKAAWDFLYNEIHEILSVCNTAYSTKNNSIYGTCVQTLKMVLGGLEELAKTDKDIANLLSDLFNRHAGTYSFLELLSPKDLETKARLVAMKEGIQELQSDGKSLFKKDLTIRELLSQVEIQSLTAQSQRNQKSIAAMMLEKKEAPNAPIVLPVDQAGHLLANLDRRLYEVFGRPASKWKSLWMSIPPGLKISDFQTKEEIEIHFIQLTILDENATCDGNFVRPADSLVDDNSIFSGKRPLRQLLKNKKVLDICWDLPSESISERNVRNLTLVDERLSLRDIEISNVERNTEYYDTGLAKETVEKFWKNLIILDKALRLKSQGKARLLNVAYPNLDKETLEREALLIGVETRPELRNVRQGFIELKSAELKQGYIAVKDFYLNARAIKK